VAGDSWLEAHPYLEPVARFCGRVEREAARLGDAAAPLPSWDDYQSDFLSGVPLLQSSLAAVDLEPAGRMAVALVERLASTPFEGQLAAEVKRLDEDLRRETAPALRVSSWLIGDRAFTPSRPGLLRYLGWVATARYLRPALEAFARTREEHRWLRSYCPTCGSPPAMAQLIGIDPGRMRYLVCGSCTTRWRYSRTGCPFCETDTRRIAVITIEGQGGLRLDYCESCRAYLKTYEGQGRETVLLADWTSIHLDVAAQDRGLRRVAASMFELDGFRARPTGSAEQTQA
jgi:FdhE protein